MRSILDKRILKRLNEPVIGARRGADGAVVGLEIESGSIGAIEVSGGGAATLSAFAVQPLPAEAFEDGEVRDPDAVAAALRELFDAHDLSKRVRLGIANQRVVVRTLRLPAIEDPAELDSAIRYSAQEQIAMPLDQAVLDHRVVGGIPASEGAPPQIDVIVVAARRDMISASLRPLREAGLEPVGVDLSAFGMIRALGEPAVQEASTDPAVEAEPPAAVLYCNVGDVTNLAVAKGRSCLFTRVSPGGLGDVAGGLAAGTGLSPEHARMWIEHVGLGSPAEQLEGDPEMIRQARAALENGASNLLDELRLSLDFYGAQETAIPVERVVLCGPGSAVAGLAGWMESNLELPIASGRPGALAGLDAASAARLTLPYGLALES
ncbi:MAG: type IV pilus assembly protein PilM [Solirubrobacterales bacterium]